jgi:hypothetical protein
MLPVVTFFFFVLAAGARSLRVLLSFAVGCLLGDVFLHLLPEVWMEQQETPAGESILAVEEQHWKGVAYYLECTKIPEAFFTLLTF